VTDEIDAPVNLVEATGSQSPLDLLSGHAQFKELPPGDNPMLPRR
jgi:hypothetical protein